MVALSFSLMSCSDFLTEDPRGKLTPENFFSTQDEPTGSLDKDNSAIVIHCLRELAHDLQRAVVIVTHDSDVARQCDRTLLLADGSLTPCAL